MTTLGMNNGDPTNRQVKIGKCIYCGEPPIGEEHIIPAGVGGILVLDMASCRGCETLVNSFERDVLNTVLYVPRVRLKIKRRQRKRTAPDRIRVAANVSGEDVFIELPISEFPAIFFLPELGPPDFLWKASPPERGVMVSGAWVCPVHPDGYKMPNVKGLKSIASPVMNTLNFSRFLAKIAHGFAVYVYGLTGFEPLLPSFIKTGGSGGGTLVGGAIITGSKKSRHLHELSIQDWPLGNERYIVVSIRLFANLGAPTYLVVAGKPKTA